MSVSISRVVMDAIRKEDAARLFYEKAAAAAAEPGARELLLRLAREEARHAELLRGKGVAEFLASNPPATNDLRIAEFLESRKVGAKASFQDVLIYAIKREDRSFRAYQALAEATSDEAARKLFRRLAQEERKHRNSLEELYDDVIFAEN